MSFSITNEAPVSFPAVPSGVTRVEYQSGVDAIPDWALIWPPARGNVWTVNLHGHGSHGDQYFIGRQDVREHLWQPVRDAGLGVVTPNLRDNAWMSPAAVRDLHELLDWIRRRYGATRFLFISGSMGGNGNLTYAILHPEDCSAVVALGAAPDLAAYCIWALGNDAGTIQRQIGDAIVSAYGALPGQMPDLYRRHSPLFNTERLTMPVFLAHGENDALMPVAPMRALAAQLADHPDCEYVEVAGGDHDSPIFCASAVPWILRQVVGLFPE